MSIIKQGIGWIGLGIAVIGVRAATEAHGNRDVLLIAMGFALAGAVLTALFPITGRRKP